jgi:hypothetical protein
MLKIVLAGLFAILSAAATADSSYNGKFGPSGAKDEFRPYGEGLPMPWPFPWAKDCPVPWSSISGRYQMMDSDLGHGVELKISVVRQNGLRIMRISRYNREGVMISDGLTLLTRSQRAVQMRLVPLVKGTYPVFASLKLHYANSEHSCDMSHLVPILALTEKKPDQITNIQYRLVRRPTR